MAIQFKKRSGSTIREFNINAVVEMLKKGMTEKDIMTLLAMSFCPDTRTDYLNTAKEKLEMENSATNLKGAETTQQQKQSEQQVTATEYMQRRNKEKNNNSVNGNTCKNCGKPTPDNTTFCSKDCLEKFKTETGKQ
jgi:hypothetical protein